MSGTNRDRLLALWGKYPSIMNDCASIFARTLDLSEDKMAKAYAIQISHPTALENKKRELKALFSDPDLDWLEFGFNDDYELMCDETAEDARNFIIRQMWEVVFPKLELPKLQ